MRVIYQIFLSLLTATLILPMAANAESIRPNVIYNGKLEPDGTPRAHMQNVIFDFAAAWATCDGNYMKKSFADNVRFSYPTTSVTGLDKMLSDLELFCSQATDTSFFFPVDAFYIDVEAGRVAAEVQFRTFQRGTRQVVNDVWIATVEKGKVTVLKEYLDGRVKDLQAQGVLELDESPEFLTPWPPRTSQWEACFPIAKAEPINTCPPT